MKAGDLIRFKMHFGVGGHSTAAWSGPALVVGPVDNPMGEPEWRIFYKGAYRVIHEEHTAIQYYARYDKEGVPYDLD